MFKHQLKKSCIHLMEACKDPEHWKAAELLLILSTVYIYRCPFISVPSLPPQLPPRRWHSQQNKQLGFSTLCCLSADDRERGGRGWPAPRFSGQVLPCILLSHDREVLGITRGEGSKKEFESVCIVTFDAFWGLLDLSFHTMQLFTSNSITALIY